MILTPEEAKRKWCPMARTSDCDNTAVNRLYGTLGAQLDCLCLSDGCACWQWATAEDAETTITMYVRHPDNARLQELETRIVSLHSRNGSRWYVPEADQPEHDQLTAELDYLRSQLQALYDSAQWVPPLPDNKPGWSLEEISVMESDESPYGGLIARFMRDKTPDERKGYCGMAGRARW